VRRTPGTGAVQEPAGPRYFVVLRDDDHPFHGEEYAVVALTSTERPEALVLRDEDWRFGGPSGDSSAAPWYCFTIKHSDIGAPQGSLTEQITDTIAAKAATYIGA